jgi:hypothetical protein
MKEAYRFGRLLSHHTIMGTASAPALAHAPVPSEKGQSSILRLEHGYAVDWLRHGSGAALRILPSFGSGSNGEAAAAVAGCPESLETPLALLYEVTEFERLS